MPTLSGPFVQDRLLARDLPGQRPFWAHFGPQNTGQTLIRESGVWSAVSYPTNTRLDAADEIRDAGGNIVKGYFIGGKVHAISSTIQTELAAAGFGAYITADVVDLTLTWGGLASRYWGEVHGTTWDAVNR